MNVKEYWDELKAIYLKEPTDELKKKMDACAYIGKMSHLLGVPAFDWEVEAFGNETHIEFDKPAINKTLAEYKPVQSVQQPVHKLMSFHEEILELDKIGAEEMIKSEKRIIKDIQYRLGVKMTEEENLVRKLCEGNRRLEAFGAIDGGLLYADIQKVEEKGFWKFVGLYYNQVVYISPHVTQTEYNPSAGINRIVPLGRFYICYNALDSVMRCWPAFDNITYNHPHPHVSKDGKICWGNAKNTVREHMAARRIEPILELLRALLMTYCPAQPYITLKRLEEVRKVPNYFTKVTKGVYHNLLLGAVHARVEVGDIVRHNGSSALGIITHMAGIDGGNVTVISSEGTLVNPAGDYTKVFDSDAPVHIKEFRFLWEWLEREDINCMERHLELIKKDYFLKGRFVSKLIRVLGMRFTVVRCLDYLQQHPDLIQKLTEEGITPPQLEVRIRNDWGRVNICEYCERAEECDESPCDCGRCPMTSCDNCENS